MIVILGARKKYDSLYSYLKKHGIKFKIFEAVSNNINASTNIKDICFTGYENFFNPGYYFSDKITKIINFRDQKNWLRLENTISQQLSLPQHIVETTLNFYTYKTVQNNVCKNLDIPTIANDSDKLIVKLDAGFSGGTGFYITTKNKYKPKENEFTQKYVIIDYTLAVHVYADKFGNLFPYVFHKIFYEKNCPKFVICPYFDNETDLLIEYLKKLKTKLLIKDRLLFWQFLKEKDGLLYNMDFNCRPAGGFETGTFDTLIGDCNILDYYVGKQNILENITFTNSVEIEYDILQQFGYSTFVKKVKPIKKINYEVKVI